MANPGDSTESLRIACASCGAKFIAEGAHAGDRVPCGLCGTEVLVQRSERARRRRSRLHRLLPRRIRRASRRVRYGWYAISFLVVLVVVTLVAMARWEDTQL